jgi:uncharacterized protein
VALDPCLEGPSSELQRAIDEFNRGQFFGCHGALEQLWMAELRPIRGLYQGMLQISVALYHLQAARYRPAITLLRRGSGYLRPFGPVCLGVEVGLLVAAAGRCLAELVRLGPDGLHGFDWSLAPKIEMRVGE